MGSELSSAHIKTLPSTLINPKLSSILPSPKRLSYQYLCQIYRNVTHVTRGSSSRPEFSGCRHLDEALFQYHFALKEDVSSDLFKAFDREEDGVIEWRPCLAGLTLCGDATLQQKCDLILSIFDLSERGSIFTEELHNVISISLLAASRICQTVVKPTNEIHINLGAAAREILDEILHTSENKNGAIPVNTLASHLENSQSLHKALSGFGLFASHNNTITTHSMPNHHVQNSPQLLRPSLSSNSLNGTQQHTLVWANVFPNHPKMPCSRSKHAACYWNNQIYIYGGRNGNTNMKDFWKFDTTSNMWTQMICGGDSPPPLQEHTLVSWNDQLYLFGGEFGFRDPDDIPLWIFDTNQKSWQQQEIKSEVKTPCSKRGHTAVISHGAMHVFGGYIDLKGSVNEFWSLDFESCWWHLNPDNVYSESPIARHLHTAVVYDDAMWVYGGLNNLVPLKDLWKWDFTSRQWSRIKFWSGPPALYGHSAVVYHDAMLVFGGQDGDGVMRNTLWKYHFGSQNWQKVISHKGLLPPPNTRHILLPIISTKLLDSPIIEDPRPRSAPHPSRQRKVTPLLQVLEQMQEMEIRPHSSPPCATQNDTSVKRKAFKNRVHPSPVAADYINIPSSQPSEEADHSISDEAPLIPTTKVSSAIPSAMSPKRLFNRSIWMATHADDILFPTDSDSIHDTDVISNPLAPDILIVEDISDVSSLSSFLDEERCQSTCEESQPLVVTGVHSPNQCNAPSISSYDNQGYLPPVSIDAPVHPHVVSSREPLSTQSTLSHQSNQKLRTNQSAMTSHLGNNLDIGTDKTPDKNFNFKTGSGFQHQTKSPVRQRVVNNIESKAELSPTMHVSPEQCLCAKNYNHLALHMQDHKCHQNKEIWTDMQSRVRNIVEPADQNKQESCSKEPSQQSEHVQDAFSTSTRYIKCKPLQGTSRNGQNIEPNMDQISNQDGATRPKLHGRSKTMQSLLLDRQAGGAVSWNQRELLSKSAHAGSIKADFVGNTSMCLILLGGQESLNNNLQYITAPISMWKCHIVPGKPTNKEIQELLSQ
ncbi:uncharacterized protein [Amphiura filiformis]|uniref:uncharacterized protein n=1 Tax=Amphiura filiformis TaxID=82378 RepID=UPI003B213522